MDAIAAAGNTTHIDLAVAWSIRGIADSGHKQDVIVKTLDLQVFQLLVSEHLYGNRYLLKVFCSFLCRYDDFLQRVGCHGWTGYSGRHGGACQSI